MGDTAGSRVFMGFTGYGEEGRDGRRAGPGGGVREARERAAAGRRLVPVGAVRQRAAVGHGPRGLQRQRRRVELPVARSGAVAGLPVGGGRAGRVLRHRAAAVPVPGAVERARPDPEGAGLRADRAAGQPRRGRQGVLVVPGRHPQPRLEPVALPLPAGPVPVPGAHRRERVPGPDAAGIRAAGHRGVRRRAVLDHRGVLRQGLARRPADDDLGDQRGAGRGDPARAADGLVPQHLVLGRLQRC